MNLNDNLPKQNKQFIRNNLLEDRLWNDNLPQKNDLQEDDNLPKNYPPHGLPNGILLFGGISIHL